MNHKFAALGIILCVTVISLAPLAAADASIDQNVTALKRDIISTIATWIPFVVLFSLLGVALAAIGLNLWGKQHQ